MPIWKRIVFTLIAFFIIPLAFLLFAECVLQLVGYGYSSRFFLKRTIGSESVYLSNWEFGKRFFPRGMEREPDPVHFSAHKNEKTIRIFVVGESAALGDPQMQFGFWRILDVLLRERYPILRFEIINTAMTSINSHVLRAIVADCARLEPDLFLIYAGNNEVIGPFGSGTVFSPISPRLGMIRANLWIKSFCVGQMVDDILYGLFFMNQTPATWEGMSMIHKRVLPDDAWLKRGYGYFERNMEDMARTATETGAKVLIGTVAVNLKDCPPFASAHRPDLTGMEEVEWNSYYEKGIALEAQGEFTAALQAYQAAEIIDATYANLQFRLAFCLYKYDQFVEARQRYIRSRDADALRFRADARINEIIRNVAGRYENEGTTLVDFAEEIQKKSRNGIPGENNFYDHVHLKFDGNYLLARAFAEKIEATLPVERIRDTTPTGDWLNRETCAERLAYTPWDEATALRVIESRYKEPPFTYQLNHDGAIARINDHLKPYYSQSPEKLLSESIDAYNTALQQAENDPYLRRYYAQRLTDDKRMIEAADQYEWLCRYDPFEPSYAYNRALALAASGLPEEALAAAEAALNARPESREAMYFKGVVQAQVGKGDEAIRTFLQVIDRFPRHHKSHYNLALLYAQKNNLAQCEFHLRKAIAINPGSAEVQNRLGVILAKQQKYAESVAVFQKALDLEPMNEEYRRNMERAQERLQTGNVEETTSTH